MSAEEKIAELERQIDELQEEKFLLQQDFKKESFIKTELQEFIGNIYHSCNTLLEDKDSELEASEVIKNLLQNIKDFAREYKIRL